MTLLAAAGWPKIAWSAEIGGTTSRNTVAERFTLGCLFRIIIDENSVEAQKAAGEAFAIAERVNDACSPLMPGAQVQSFCSKPHGQAHEVGPGFFEALEQTRRLAELTEGRFDPTHGPLTALWKLARQRKSLPTADELAKARESVGWRHLVLDAEKRTAMLEKEGMRLDFGAVARGFAVDKMLQQLIERGFPQAIVRAGDDFRVGDPPKGAESWHLKIRVSDEDGERILVLPLSKGAISTAGGMGQSTRIGETKYADMLDPATGFGLTRFVSATVLAETATISSALAFAACVAGQETTNSSFAAWGAKAVRMVLEDGEKKQVVVMGAFPQEVS
jgi:FAD:protein FMN transferase